MASFLNLTKVINTKGVNMNNYQRARSAFTADRDWKKIDAQARTGNLQIKEMQLQEMVNELRKAGAFFDFVNDAKVNSIAQRLQTNKIGVVGLRVACKRIIEGFDRFPSYKAIYELCRTIPIEPYDAAWEKHKEIMAEEEKELKPIREKFTTVFGDEGLAKCVEWWVKTNFELDKEMIESFIGASPAFEKCVLFDWKDAGFPTKHFEAKMKEVFEKKKNKQLNNNGMRRILP